MQLTLAEFLKEDLPVEDTVIRATGFADIEVLLSRPMTWGEREAMMKWYPKLSFGGATVINLLSKKVPSRKLFKRLARTLETEFVNLYPKSVKTHSEVEQ